MNPYPSMRGRALLRALQRNGWRIDRKVGSHRRLVHDTYPPMTFAYHDRADIGPVAVRRVCQLAGIAPEDL